MKKLSLTDFADLLKYDILYSSSELTHKIMDEFCFNSNILLIYYYDENHVSYFGDVNTDRRRSIILDMHVEDVFSTTDETTVNIEKWFKKNKINITAGDFFHYNLANISINLKPQVKFIAFLVLTGLQGYLWNPNLSEDEDSSWIFNSIPLQHTNLPGFLNCHYYISDEIVEFFIKNKLPVPSVLAVDSLYNSYSHSVYDDMCIAMQEENEEYGVLESFKRFYFECENSIKIGISSLASFVASHSPDNINTSQVIDGNAEYAFYKNGEIWACSFEGSITLINDTKGMRYIHTILSNPCINYLPEDLYYSVNKTYVNDTTYRLAANPTESSSLGKDPIVHNLDLHSFEQGISRAIAELESLLTTNCIDIEEYHEKMELLRKMVADYKSKGRSFSKKEIKNLRQTVRKSVEDALERIKAYDIQLHKHLEHILITKGSKALGGASYSYRPAHKISWKLTV
jgi:hypothetical protein